MNPDLQLLRRLSILHSVRQVADGVIVEPEYRWITDVLLAMKEVTPLVYNALASVTPEFDSEEKLRSYDSQCTALRVTGRILTRNHTIKLDKLAPAFQTAYAKVGLTIGVIAGKLQFYSTASFTKQNRRITVKPGMNIIHDNADTPAHVDSITVHVRLHGASVAFLMIKQWRQVGTDALFDCPILELETSSHAIHLTSVKAHIPHLVGCGPENSTRSWWNQWDVHFH